MVLLFNIKLEEIHDYYQISNKSCKTLQYLRNWQMLQILDIFLFIFLQHQVWYSRMTSTRANFAVRVSANTDITLATPTGIARK